MFITLNKVNIEMKFKGLILVSLGACSYGILSTLVVLAYRAGYSLNDVIGSQTVLGAILLWFLLPQAH